MPILGVLVQQYARLSIYMMCYNRNGGTIIYNTARLIIFDHNNQHCLTMDTNYMQRKLRFWKSRSYEWGRKALRLRLMRLSLPGWEISDVEKKTLYCKSPYRTRSKKNRRGENKSWRFFKRDLLASSAGNSLAKVLWITENLKLGIVRRLDIYLSTGKTNIQKELYYCQFLLWRQTWRWRKKITGYLLSNNSLHLFLTSCFVLSIISRFDKKKQGYKFETRIQLNTHDKNDKSKLT